MEDLEGKLAMAILKKDKGEVINAIALVLSKHIIFTEKDKVVIEIVKNVSTDFSRSAICFEILENMQND